MQMNQFKRSAISMALVAAAMAAGTAQAGVVTLDVTGIASNAEAGDASNERRFIDILAGVRITNLSWDVTLTAESPSYLSEIGVNLNYGALAGLSLFPGVFDDFTGSASYIGDADLIALGVDFFLGADGRLNFEFIEYFDDIIDAADGQWARGNLTVTYVPEPASFGLAALALLGVGVTSRRKKV